MKRKSLNLQCEINILQTKINPSLKFSSQGPNLHSRIKNIPIRSTVAKIKKIEVTT